MPSSSLNRRSLAPKAKRSQPLSVHISNESPSSPLNGVLDNVRESILAVTLSATLLLNPLAAFAENELANKYGNGKAMDTSLVDQTCLMDKCSLQSKACLVDDPSCRKGLTCTAKCMGDNACITGCMARYGNSHLDDLLKCTIEDNECIKVAILPGGADAPGDEKPSPIKTVKDFKMASLEGRWFKVVGFNPNYDCYACQRNTFTHASVDSLDVAVEFSMPRLLEDGSPPPPTNRAEKIFVDSSGSVTGGRAIQLNDYKTTEKMVFDTPHTLKNTDPSSSQISLASMNYARTAHSEGEMFGLKFWENWYVIGENDKDEDEFKVIYYEGKTRQNTYQGAFVYAREKELPEASMGKVYSIAKDAGLNPDGFCRIRNGCFDSPNPAEPQKRGFFEGLVASTKVSELLGVEPVFGEGLLKKVEDEVVREEQLVAAKARGWWWEVGDYLENPHRHFKLIDELRTPMDWPESVAARRKL
ncbi:hypothetical protein TrST_g10838 [Triparma strigata]|nr:hypothetical protein TrST_g10838 [Triparma strigata]